MQEDVKFRMNNEQEDKVIATQQAMTQRTKAGMNTNCKFQITN